MFSFLKFILLVENHKEKRYDFLQKKYADISFDHDVNSDTKTTTFKPDYLLQRVMGHDPDQKKFSNSDWMMSQYHKGHYKQEDLPRIQGQVSKFHEMKHDFPSKDLNSYTLNQDKEPKKHDLVSHLRSKQAHNDQFPDGPRFEGHPGAEKIHDDGKGTTVHVLHTHEAGRAARASCEHDDESGGWCFGWKSPGHFNSYSKQGPIHLIQTPDNKKHALHFPSGQLMDKDDGEVHADDLVKKYPSLVGARLDTTNHTDEPNSMDHVMPFLSERGKKYRIEYDFEAGDESPIQYHEENHPELITKANTHEAMQHYKNGTIRGALVAKLPHLTQDHIDTIWDHERDPSRPNRVSAVHMDLMHKTMNPNHLSHILHADNRSDMDKDGAGERLHREFGKIPPIRSMPPHDVSEIYGRKIYHDERSAQLNKTLQGYKEGGTRYLSGHPLHNVTPKKIEHLERIKDKAKAAHPK